MFNYVLLNADRYSIASYLRALCAPVVSRYWLGWIYGLTTIYRRETSNIRECWGVKADTDIKLAVSLRP